MTDGRGQSPAMKKNWGQGKENRRANMAGMNNMGNLSDI